MSKTPNNTKIIIVLEVTIDEETCAEHHITSEQVQKHLKITESEQGISIQTDIPELDGYRPYVLYEPKLLTTCAN